MELYGRFFVLPFSGSFASLAEADLRKDDDGHVDAALGVRHEIGELLRIQAAHHARGDRAISWYMRFSLENDGRVFDGAISSTRPSRVAR